MISSIYVGKMCVNDDEVRFSKDVIVAYCKMLSLVFFVRPRSRCYGRNAALRLIVQPCDDDDFFFVFPCNGAPVEWNCQGKTCPSAILSTTNPTWTDPGSNLLSRPYPRADHDLARYKGNHTCRWLEETVSIPAENRHWVLGSRVPRRVVKSLRRLLAATTEWFTDFIGQRLPVLPFELSRTWQQIKM
jgi:hypothetical protein